MERRCRCDPSHQTAARSHHHDAVRSSNPGQRRQGLQRGWRVHEPLACLQGHEAVAGEDGRAQGANKEGATAMSEELMIGFVLGCYVATVVVAAAQALVLHCRRR